MFSKFANLVPIDLKIGTHIDWTYGMYHYSVYYVAVEGAKQQHFCLYNTLLNTTIYPASGLLNSQLGAYSQQHTAITPGKPVRRYT